MHPTVESRVPEIAAAVARALRAPSVHNTQPWRWRIDPAAIELHADWDRHLAATDPDRRDLVISCGAALHHLAVALAAIDRSVTIDRMPDPEDAGHLATIHLGSGPGDAEDAALYAAIDERRTERRRMSHLPVPATAVDDLVREAARLGVLLVPVSGDAMRARLSDALVRAAREQAATPGYLAELRLWTERYPGSHDGVPAAAVAPVPPGLPTPSPLRRFPHARLQQPRQLTGHGRPDDAAEFLVVVTPTDGIVDRLRAGEATSAVLLAATRGGLATTPLSQGMEIEATRHAIRTEVLHVPEHPQLLLRVGWPATESEALPPTPRRDIRSVLVS
ncbi:Acg family FMN-binding oxidoreductase [Pseudonocardia sp. GCM10023141]|uniref:Acg family FMN-binding oxidoreductase n=1 Tax=Pseudonocardia sp. GCM10023141 TaxID=3252653 RepID=UPI00362141F1